MDPSVGMLGMFVGSFAAEPEGGGFVVAFGHVWTTRVQEPVR